MTDYFNKLNDNDFFSDKLTHIYFNGIVEDKSVDKLFNDIRDANKIRIKNGASIRPKPILIHINSSVFSNILKLKDISESINNK